MNTIFSIGEVSKIFGISVHSLRHYHKINLIVPDHIDKNTGYRYYTFDQFQYFSRLKYYRSIGLSLEQIKKVFSSGNVSDLNKILSSIKSQKEKEIEEINDIIKKIDWINSYYEFTKNNDLDSLVYKKHFEERVLLSSISKNHAVLEDMDIELHKIINLKKHNDIKYLRQFGYIINFHSLLEGKFNPESATILLSESSSIESKYIKTLPKGDYLCYCVKLLSNNFDISPVKNYVQKKKNKLPKITIAFEYEDHLKEYYNAIYEIQMLF